MRFYTTIYLLLTSFHLIAQLESPPITLNANEIIESEAHMDVKNETEAIYSVRKRITILNEESNANLFYVHYDPKSKILNLDAQILDINGNPIRRVKQSEIRDVSAADGYSLQIDDRVQYIELNHSEYPYIVEFNYTQRLKGFYFASFPHWAFQERTSAAISSSSYTITTPSTMGIQYRTYNVEVNPQISHKGGKTSYTWKVSKLPTIKAEPYAPPWHRILPMLRVSLNNFKIDNYTGSMKSWKEYGDFLYQLHEGRDELTDELKEKINALTTDATSKREKIERLYRFMQKNKRYVSIQLGIGGWQPFDAIHVEEHGYGDCKALSNYMKAMLKEIGIESYPVVIYADEAKPYYIEDDFVDPTFNHEILYVPEEDLWLECTSSVNIPGYLGIQCQDRRALLITPEGGQIAHTPKWGAKNNLREEKIDIILAKDGSAFLNYLANFQGGEHEKWRYRSFYTSQEELEQSIRQIGKLPNLTLGTVALENSSQTPSSSLQFDANISRYATRVGKRLFVPINLICPQTETPISAANRQLSIVSTYGYSSESTFQFTLPEGYKLESLPDNLALDTPYGKYKIVLSYENNTVSCHRKLSIYNEEYAAANYEDFRDFYLTIAKADAYKMVLVAE